MAPVEKKPPAQDLLLTTETLVILEYGMDVSATRFPTNDLSWMITRWLVRPRNPVPAPTASYTAMIDSPSIRPLSICRNCSLRSYTGSVTSLLALAGRRPVDHRQW